ncbi:MAG: hypothetical protein KDA60_06790 [Planctomycetales bacterium]|nr:hypothetical protein [Planctomycetales bacterium]
MYPRSRNQWALALGLVLVLLTVRTTLRGLFIPVRVVSGSMAECLRGPHWSVTCPACGMPVVCGTDVAPQDHVLTCANCGSHPIPLKGESIRGDRVLVWQVDAFTRRYQRGDVIAFQSAHASGTWQVKRIAGLPGESIMIRDGDVWTDGRRLEKSLPQLEAMALVVYDRRYRRADEAIGRWRPQRESNVHGWREEGDDLRWCAADTKQDASSDWEWLTYHHRSGTPPPPEPGTPQPVTDNYGYNQGLSRPLHYVADLLVTGEMEFTGMPNVAWRWQASTEPVVIAWHGEQARVTNGNGLPTDDRDASSSVRVITAKEQIDVAGHVAQARTYRFVVACCDGRIMLSINDMLLVSQTLNGDFVATDMPWSIGLRGRANVVIRELQIKRDVHVTHPEFREADWVSARPLASDEYFVLGDNSPLSKDSRHGDECGVVRREQIRGRVVPWRRGTP